MANKQKYPIGTKVRIINCSMIEPYELNEIGTIVDTKDCNSERFTYIVDMGRPRRPDDNEDSETCWWLPESAIELVNKPNEQLLFSFMYE